MAQVWLRCGSGVALVWLWCGSGVARGMARGVALVWRSLRVGVNFKVWLLVWLRRDVAKQKGGTEGCGSEKRVGGDGWCEVWLVGVHN